MNSTTSVKRWARRCTAISAVIIGLVIITGHIFLKKPEGLLAPVPTQDLGGLVVPNQQLVELVAVSDSPSKASPVIYGFLPYWNISHFTLNRVVTHLAYFSFELDAKGNFIATSPGYSNFGGEAYQEFAAQAVAAGKKNELVVAMFDADNTAAFLNCKTCRENFYEQVLELIKTKNLSGINIDFEYLGTVTPQLRKNYTLFLQGLRGSLQRSGMREVKISIDIFGDGANMYNLWDMKEISQIVDYVIVMGYDYKTRRSDVPGPVAPTLGKDSWGNDILGGLKKLLEQVPPEKVILAVPFYGYEWRVTGRSLDEAKTYPGTGATLTYKRLQELLGRRRELRLEERWDESSLTPYITYEEDEEIFMAFFENARSMNYKVDLARGLNLAGVAIWALGYEGESSSLWPAIESFTKGQLN